MAISPAELWAETQIPASVTVVFTSPAGTNGTWIKRAVFTNTDTVARLFSVYKVPNGGTPTTANLLIQNYSLSSGEDYVPQSMINMVLPVGTTIQVVASTANVINTTGSGFLF